MPPSSKPELGIPFRIGVSAIWLTRVGKVMARSQVPQTEGALRDVSTMIAYPQRVALRANQYFACMREDSPQPRSWLRGFGSILMLLELDLGRHLLGLPVGRGSLLTV